MHNALTGPAHKLFRVAIIGGGASGTLLALQLAARGITADVFDENGAFGRGVAYSATAPWHRLNVPIEKIGSAEKADGESFLDWYCRARQASFATYAERFVPREAYGAWLSEQLEHAVGIGLTSLHRAKVCAVSGTTDGITVGTEAGGNHRADAAVLCLGNHPPRPLLTTPSTRYVNDIWVNPGLTRVDADDSVLIVGTGATGIDAVLELLHRGHIGPIYVVSRRALMPLVDRPPHPYEAQLKFGDEVHARRIVRMLRDEVAIANARGVFWQNVIDAFRPSIEGIWERMPDGEKRQFLRHLRAVWLVHRHRLAPDIAEQMAKLRAEGRLTVIQGRLTTVDTSDRGHAVTVRQRGGEGRTLHVGWIVNCTGPEEDYRRLDDRLVRSLFTTGTVRAGDFGVGLDVDRNCRLFAADGTVHRRLYALGPATRMRFGEVTSAPQIRTRAVAVANEIAKLVTSPAAEQCPDFLR